jgi:hypothetical protein
MTDALRFAPVLLLAAACGADGPRPEDALSTELAPAQPAAHYVDQAQRYFDALDEAADPASLPTYGLRVARWEWPPWLYLTGYGAEQMAALDETVKAATPATIPERDCRAFEVQPFARCRVVFVYADGPCPIYEEFTFNPQGEITFIEAWSDLDGLRPTTPDDAWGEGELHRLSTRVPGLGNATGLVDPASPGMREAAAHDPELADFVARTEEFWDHWFRAYDEAGDDLFARGCGWTP